MVCASTCHMASRCFYARAILRPGAFMYGMYALRLLWLWLWGAYAAGSGLAVCRARTFALRSVDQPTSCPCPMLACMCVQAPTALAELWPSKRQPLHSRPSLHSTFRLNEMRGQHESSCCRRVASAGKECAFAVGLSGRLCAPCLCCCLPVGLATIAARAAFLRCPCVCSVRGCFGMWVLS